MTLKISDTEFRLLRDLIEEECGISLGANKMYLVENRLEESLKEFGCCTYGDLYLKAKCSREGNRIRSSLVEAISTNETFWFRDQYPFSILREKLLPEMQAAMDAGRKSRISIWSAGCSTGQEPYSIAMTVLDYYRRSGSDSVCHGWVEILGTDISGVSLCAAEKGRYDETATGRGLPAACMQRYFKRENGCWFLDDAVKRLVTFRNFNLKNIPRGLGPFDVVYLRNVMIYLSDSLKKDILDRVAGLLSRGGYLFLGTGETVRAYSGAFDIIQEENAIYYRLK